MVPAPEAPAGITVVMPAYNEAGAIVQTLTALQAVLSKIERETELFVVDDGSSDETADLARSAGATVIRHPTNGGYGCSLLTGIEAARFDTIVIVDADGTYPVASLPELLAVYDRGFDMVVGRRQGRHYEQSVAKRTLRTVFRLLAEFACGCSILDINSGFRVFSRGPVLAARASLSSGFSFTTTITLLFLLSHLFVGYVPIPYHQRVGASKVRLVRDGLRSFQIIISAIARFNPLKLYLLLLIVYWTGMLALLFAAGPGPFQATTSTALMFGWTTSCVIAACAILAIAIGKSRSTEQVLVHRRSVKRPPAGAH